MSCNFKCSAYRAFATSLVDILRIHSFDECLGVIQMGTLMISIIFALFVEEGIKYLRQTKREMYDQ